MMGKLHIKKYMSLISTCVLFFLVLAVWLFTPSYSNTLFSSAWDGSVSTEFSYGNGSINNPYPLQNGSDFAYLKELLEGVNAEIYSDKHYILTSDINFGNNEFHIDNVIPFSGTINGDANTIIKGELESGLFNSLDGATIKNLNFNQITLVSDEYNISALLSNTSLDSNFENITASLSYEVNVENYVGSFLGTDEGSILKNIIIDIDYIIGEGLEGNISAILYEGTNTTLENIIIKKNIAVENLYLIDDNITISNVYEYDVINSNIVIENETVTTILDNLIDSEEYVYNIKNNKIVFEKVIVEMPIMMLGDPMMSSAMISVQNSGIVGSTVYVNDLDADYNYYNGLNYATTPATGLPNGENQNIYNDSNLVRVQINYSGTDSVRNLTGYVSLTELQSNFVYYRYYPVENGKVKIELIDNPYSNRPNNMGFNNWVLEGTGTVSFDVQIYKRYVEVDVSYLNGRPEDIVLSFHASWTLASVGVKDTATTAASWNTAFSSLQNKGMAQFSNTETAYNDNFDMRQGVRQSTQYYYQKTFTRNQTVPAGHVQANGNTATSCTSSSGCTYYQIINTTYFTSPEYYSHDLTYYVRSGNSMAVVSPTSISGLTFTRVIPALIGNSMAGYYLAVTIPRNSSIIGYYSSAGVLQTTGTCTTNPSCTYYRYLQSYDEYGNEPIFSSSTTYYYMATRDTNIIYLPNSFTSSNTNTSWANTTAQAQNKPFTFTSVHNGIDYRSTNNAVWTVSTYVNLYNDVRIENMRISSGQAGSTANPTGANNTARYIYGNYKNLKIGRGILQSTNSNGSTTYTNFIGVIGGNATAVTLANIAKFTTIIESGFYSNISLALPMVNSTTTTMYIDMQGVYGSDYDRISGNNNNLRVHFVAAATWGAVLRGATLTSTAVSLTVKSGSFGTSTYDHTTGIYVGGRGYGAHYAAKSIKIEGGYIYNLTGGPTTGDKTGTTRENNNDIFIHQTGGEIDMITAGAGTSETFGNRIVSLTGGIVNYSVFGGSNSYNGATTDGTLTGSSFIYVGGNAQVGSSENVNNGRTLWGSEAGSVFGVGNGQSGINYVNLGSGANSNIIIDGNADIRRNIYGGGNYGAVGLSGSGNTAKTNIIINGGTIRGDVYGGGNRNGFATTTKAPNSSINIKMNNGNVYGSIYGGSNIIGTINGSTNVDIVYGTIGTNVYGGGKGNETYVSRSVNVSIGEINSIPVISGSVYGGSALGVVNAIVNNSDYSTHPTTVTIKNGIITNSVFGGGQGNASYTASVAGNITVNVNAGNMGYVYGGCDQSGIPNGTVIVNLNGGIIGEAYGGGNRATVRGTDIRLNGATTTYLFGGSNSLGAVTRTIVTITSGTVDYVFGGNNVGGSVATSNVYVNGGTITNVYGGGNLIYTGTTNLYLNASDNQIAYAFGGGKSAPVATTNVFKNGANVSAIFGGSDTSGVVTKANIEYNEGTTASVFGGNNVGGSTTESSINVISGTITSLYGGGYLASTGSSIINVNNGTITNVYGGGNEAGITNSTINVNGGLLNSVYGGSNTSGTAINANVNIIGSATIGTLYGGNNAGGQTMNPSIYVEDGNIGNIYGGGNLAVTEKTDIEVVGGTVGNIYGGGNQAAITRNTNVHINGGTILINVYGGGNYGTVLENTKVYVVDANIGGSIHAGGNGLSAIVYGDTDISIGGDTVVGNNSSVAPISGSVFGGGNAAATGESTRNNSVATVNIAGGSIYGNVYGGANTSVVYGTTALNIGLDTIADKTLKKGDIYIKGTIFGGGEANASGSEIYDYSFISVTNGIDVKINGTGYNDFVMTGSIFGSGNASSTQGLSTITITNYGTFINPQRNVSIQRTNILTLNNSSIILTGATDRTNEYSDVLFTLSIIDNLKITNNSNLFLETGANLLKRWESLTSAGQYQSVTINNGIVTKNVDNRVYMYEGRNLNIATNESVTSYGEVFGMTFFGMYTYDRDNLPNTGIYNPQYNHGDLLNWGDMPNKGSYVLGLHKVNHDIEVDGFYSNFMDEATGTNDIQFVDPTPKDSSFFMWVIGEAIIEYNIDLVASKYATLGMTELTFLEFSKPNTTFQVVGFDDGNLNAGVSLIDGALVPRVADDSMQANNVMGLSMKSSISGWLTKGETKYLTSSPNIVGTTNYVGENSTAIPSLIFYLYHSKNLNDSEELGSVEITIMATTKIDALTNETKRLLIIVNLSTAIYQTNEYEGAMTAGREYSIFSSSVVNITSKSAISAYYSLYVEGGSIYQQGFHRSLVSTYVLPLNTKITMIDFAEETPVYYYHVIDANDITRTQAEYAMYGEASYDLSLFIKMGSVNNLTTYDDAIMNDIYFSQTDGITDEEFIFIVDFEDSNISSDVYDKSLLIELRDENNHTIFSVLGIQHQSLTYNIHHNKDAVIDVVANISNNFIYAGHSVNLDVTTNFINNRVGGNAIFDTSFFDTKLGVKISILNNLGEVVTGTSLMGVSFVMDNIRYYPNIDGTTRIKISDRVGNVSTWMTLDTSNTTLPTGNYTIKIESFNSPDGIYYGIASSDTELIPITIINDIYGLDAKIMEHSVIIDAQTGLNQNDTSHLDYEIMYSSGLSIPNIRLKMFRRDYTSLYATDYEEVDLTSYVSDTLISTTLENEYLILNSPNATNVMNLSMKTYLKTGTYRLDFSLYDGDVYIGKISRYIIIK